MIKYSRNSKAKVKRIKVVSLATTLYLNGVPAVGTIWFDKLPTLKLREVFTVDNVSSLIVSYKKNILKHSDSLDEFANAVQTGRYVLVGVELPSQSYLP